MKRGLVTGIIAIILVLSTHAFAQDIKFEPDGLPTKETMEAMKKQLAEKAEKIYAEEGGKRKKNTIIIECITNSMLQGFTEALGDLRQKKDFATIHTGTLTTESIVARSTKEEPGIKVDQSLMAYMYAVDADSYLAEEKIDEAIATYKKMSSNKKIVSTIGTKRTASLYFNIGYLHMLKKDMQNAKKNFNIALNMKELDPEYKQAISDFKKKGLIK